MRKAVILGTREAAIIDAPDPRPKNDWAVVKVRATAMCTEYKAFIAGHRQDILGHEGAGDVVDVAYPGCGVEVGDRVVILPQTACGRCEHCLAGNFVYCENDIDHRAFMGTAEGAGTFAQYVVKPSRLLKRIPDNITYEYATMVIDGVGTPFGALQAIGLSVFDTILITGLGPVGLGGVLNSRYHRARVIGVEPLPWRRERAMQMGAEAAFDPNDEDLLEKIAACNGGRRVDCAMDCSGTVQGQRLCIDAVRRRGRVAIVGESSKDLPIQASRDLIRKGLTIVGNWCWNMSDLPRIMRVIEESPLMALLVSHVMSMERIQAAFELLARGECAKIVLKPWD